MEVMGGWINRAVENIQKRRTVIKSHDWRERANLFGKHALANELLSAEALRASAPCLIQRSPKYWVGFEKSISSVLLSLDR